MNIRYTIYLEKELHKDISKYVYEKQTSLASIIRNFLFDTIEKEGINLEIPRIRGKCRKNCLLLNVKRDIIKKEEIIPRVKLSQEEMLKTLEDS